MSFSPVAIVLVIVGILAVIIGIRGSNNAVFQTLTGHTTTGTVATPGSTTAPGGSSPFGSTAPNSGQVGEGVGPLLTSPLVSGNPTNSTPVM